MYYQTKQPEPCAFITKGKSRIRQHGENVYLKNQTEFEIELFNPTQTSVLAKIKLNGNYISGGGIVLKPGQRIFLERYLDSPNKFKFETYSIETNDGDIKKAIENNGDVVVKFYPEKVSYAPTNLWMNYTYHNDPWSSNSGSLNYSNGTTTTYYAGLSTNTASFSNTDGIDYVETGTVEKGSISDQSLSYSNKQFSDFCCSISKWKILPDSVKPYDTKDLTKYCVECGCKIKKSSWKFCPNCGENLQ